MSYTPGPWHVEDYLTHGHEVRNDDDFLVASTSMAGNRALSNARLIAAAPEMAELVEKLLDYIGSPCDDPVKNPHVEVWCITHQEKRCTGTADYNATLALLSRIRGEA